MRACISSCVHVPSSLYITYPTSPPTYLPYPTVLHLPTLPICVRTGVLNMADQDVEAQGQGRWLRQEEEGGGPFVLAEAEEVEGVLLGHLFCWRFVCVSTGRHEAILSTCISP